ncbi:MAG: response regulator [Acidiphilium sp.]|jgi:Response regulator containing CheY-like receiver domain and AraC-type DNA-binding domain|uniref:Response regulator n=1 Tax=Acidiphilium acidophilum TaxID=76588 RepID=A0AAW9DRF1_ACIAO|nr:response regulator [Acidiphilium acidophilum]MDD2861219.1 response regulator [Acidiphilium sp.]MDX5931784.1 response regulator [Acidiphilium acidophilum]MEE3502563.1 response regulator [Acidiphilium acidophilum]GBQ09687.1 chemotaxis protein CheY [Acidiphilium acidophilum DSM 700]
MPQASTLTILVVDDQQTIRSLARMALEQLKIGEILEASDGEEALKVILTRKTPIHLIISDYNMPNLNGLSLLRAVRAHPPISKTAFIMLTGRADKQMVLTAVEHGVNNYLVKPFTPESMREKIEAVIGALK